MVVAAVQVARVRPSPPVEPVHEPVLPRLLGGFRAIVWDERVRVLIGSTAKMGTGMNVQERLVALHHLDAPESAADRRSQCVELGLGAEGIQVPRTSGQPAATCTA